MNNDTDSLNEKKVLITGGGSGMGRAVALSMARKVLVLEYVAGEKMHC